MNVKQLIDKLQQYNPDTMVIVNGYEGGVDECMTCNEKFIELDVNSESWYGKHEIVDTLEASDCKAILIG